MLPKVRRGTKPEAGGSLRRDGTVPTPAHVLRWRMIWTSAYTAKTTPKNRAVRGRQAARRRAGFAGRIPDPPTRGPAAPVKSAFL
jgi:hypothetical protein